MGDAAAGHTLVNMRVATLCAAALALVAPLALAERENLQEKVGVHTMPTTMAEYKHEQSSFGEPYAMPPVLRPAR